MQNLPANDACILTTQTAALDEHAQLCVVAQSLLHDLNSCWKRPTCLHVGWEFLSPHLCGPSVRQAVTNVCISGWFTTEDVWDMFELVCRAYKQILLSIPVVMRDKPVKQYYSRPFLLIKLISSINPSTPLSISVNHYLLGFQTPLHFHPLCIYVFTLLLFILVCTMCFFFLSSFHLLKSWTSPGL